MAKEKITLTLDAGRLEDLRRIAAARGISAAVDRAVEAYLARLRDLVAVDDWLAEQEQEHGPIPTETLDWAAKIVDQWENRTQAAGQHSGG
jgi:hypothetical protein